jgi:hypothetical protein
MNVRQKGANGELEAAKWLHKWLRLKEIPQRNLEQVRSGGHDLTGVGKLAVEVKRCEKLAHSMWWDQACRECPKNMLPVVMYRQNKKKWKFLISAQTIGIEIGYIELDMEVFIRWARGRL